MKALSRGQAVFGLILLVRVTPGAIRPAIRLSASQDAGTPLTETVKLKKSFEVRRVQGQVLTEDGLPFEGVLLELTGPSLSGQTRTATTDSHGRFKLSHVPQGQYTARFTKESWQSVVCTVVVSGKARRDRTITIKMPLGR